MSAIGVAEPVAATAEPDAVLAGRAAKRRRHRRQLLSNAAWYVVLTLLAVITVFPFLWMLLTSLKGPLDPIASVPPQLIPGHPTLANY
jgi:putative chitobiose transport system permease protein